MHVEPMKRIAYLWAFADEVLFEQFASLVRVSDVFERFRCVLASLSEQDFVASRVLLRGELLAQRI